MANKKRKKGGKRRGHFCWCCATNRPNEQFSAKGHKQHLCSTCMQLASDELEFRQALRNMEKCVGFSGRVYRRRRREFDTYLRHENPQIRAAAERLVWSADEFAEDRGQPVWERAAYDLLTQACRILADEQQTINDELNDAAELDRPLFESDGCC